MTRDDELPGLDVPRVEAWMLEHVADLQSPLEFQLIGGGHSNITYGVEDGHGRRCVIRRPPLGEISAKAHDMRREHVVLDALAPTVVPVPRPLGLCTDEAVNGRPFYVMERVDGHVVENPDVAARALPAPAARRRASEQIIDVLADLHRVDVDAVGLGDVAKREDFLERQLHRMGSTWERTKTRELPLLDDVHARLLATRPPQRHTGIVHSDYRFGNVVVADDGDVVAVLDWELWTLGDVLADVGFLLNNWYEPDETTPLVWMEVPPTMAGGFSTRGEILDRYADLTGFDLSDVEYYRAFQYWKLAVLAEGVKRRYESSTMATADVDFDHLDTRVVHLAELADDRLRRSA